MKVGYAVEQTKNRVFLCVDISDSQLCSIKKVASSIYISDLGGNNKLIDFERGDSREALELLTKMNGKEIGYAPMQPATYW